MTESNVQSTVKDSIQLPTLSADQHHGLHARVVEVIGSRIVEGGFESGEVLPDQAELSRQLDVSRTVIREAARVLREKGLVESKPKVGTTVTARRRWRLLDPDVIRWISASPAKDRERVLPDEPAHLSDG